MSNKEKKIAIMDSGVGGFCILQACAQAMPQYQYIYCSDDKNYPYGTKAEEEVIKCTHSVVDALINNFQPDLVVIACNTASTVALPSLREKFSVPFVGVVPAIKPAAQLTKTGVIGLLATPATVERPYVDELISEFAPQYQVIKLGSKLLVDLAEQLVRGRSPNMVEIEQELMPFCETKCDTVVLLSLIHISEPTRPY